MKRVYRITFLTVAAVIICVVAAHQFLLKEDAQKTIKVGFLYVGDATTTYTNNFIKAQIAVENEYGDRVEVIANNCHGADHGVVEDCSWITACIKCLLDSLSDFFIFSILG